MSAQKALDAGKFKEAILLFKNELDSENRKVHPNKTKVAEFNNGLNVSRSKHGMEFIALAKAKGVLRNDKRESLMLAYKWFSLMDADHQDANATKQKVYAEGVLKNEFGSDFLTQSNSIVDATLLIAEWKNDESLLLDPDEQKAVDLLTKAHVAQFAPAHGHGDAHGKGHEVHWTYSGDTGPEHWGKSFPVALHGTAQSPINIETQDVKEASFLEAVHFNYNPNSMFEVRNNGHTLHVNVTTPKGEAVNLMMIGTNHFKLLQFHFHAKSEHMVNGRHSPMELHLVHELVKLDGEGKVIAEKAAQPDAHGHDDGHAAAHAAPKETKKLAVIGVMIEQLNEDNTEHSHKNFIRKVWQVLPKVDEKTAEASTGVLLFDMHPGELLPPEGKRSYYRYQGSLTTPPCTEGVTWTILQEPVYYDKKQIEAFEGMKFFSEIGQKNNRPVQPLNARYVLRYQDAQRSTSTTSAPSVGSHTKPATLIPSADPHWDHQLKGKSGQDNWHKLKPEWSIAATGRRQSPINIATARAVNVLKVDPTLMRPLQVYYNSSPITVINNGHTIKAIFNKDDKTSMTLGGERYRLLQFHFHHRSEHKIDDRDYAMELHLVHEQVADPSKLAVIGVMIEEGAENTHVKGFWEHLPKPAGHGAVVRGDSYNFNPVTLIPNGGDYFQYQGSLTTPPCSENVYWTVMQKPITFSKEQIEAFSKMFPKNNRDVQSPFVRQILRYNFSRN